VPLREAEKTNTNNVLNIQNDPGAIIATPFCSLPSKHSCNYCDWPGCCNYASRKKQSGRSCHVIVFLINMTSALPALQGDDLLQTKFRVAHLALFGKRRGAGTDVTITLCGILTLRLLLR
jgi:hypothetical protein